MSEHEETMNNDEISFIYENRMIKHHELTEITPMFFKIIVLLVFAVVLYCLGSGAFYLLKKDAGKSFAKALTWRIIISVFLFGFLFFAFWMGWIAPHSL